MPDKQKGNYYKRGEDQKTQPAKNANTKKPNAPAPNPKKK